MESLSLKPSNRQKSAHHEIELAGCSALIADSDNTSRSVLAGQLRDFGFTDIQQHSRVVGAREQLQTRRFDVILCAHYFGPDSPTGQDLLDDLRRDSLLPMSTVFIMVTSEASYAKVEQAAEAALDGYVLKPHSAAVLVQRLLAARRRKMALVDVFEALENERMDEAIAACVRRFSDGGTYALYCARMGAELMLRSGQYAAAASLFKAVGVQANEPWAKAGIARTMLGAGQFSPAVALLQEITTEWPDFVDAFDVMGRAQLKQGHLDQAIESYRRASELTPASIGRLQRLGMLAYYVGDTGEAESLLDRATRLGHDTRSFDYQTLALLALVRTATSNGPGVQRCRDIARALLKKSPDNVRLRRMAMLVEGMASLKHNDPADAVALARDISSDVLEPDFDFDLACILVSYLCLLAIEGVHFDGSQHTIKLLGNRYCTSEATHALLVAAAKRHDPYAKLVQQCNEQMLELSERAMKSQLEGDFRTAINSFLNIAEEHLNARAFETAQQLYHRYAKGQTDAEPMEQRLYSLRERVGAARSRPGFGDSQGRPPAGVALRIGNPAPEVSSNW